MDLIIVIIKIYELGRNAVYISCFWYMQWCVFHHWLIFFIFLIGLRSGETEATFAVNCLLVCLCQTIVPNCLELKELILSTFFILQLLFYTNEVLHITLMFQFDTSIEIRIETFDHFYIKFRYFEANISLEITKLTKNYLTLYNFNEKRVLYTWISFGRIILINNLICD